MEYRHIRCHRKAVVKRLDQPKKTNVIDLALASRARPASW